MKLYGLIGYPLTHSFSKKYYHEKFERENLLEFYYENFEIENLADVKKLIHQYPNLKGLNVTIPYKLQVLGMLDQLDKEAENIGAVNCIKINRTKEKPKLTGYNTDVYGFEESLKPLLKPHQKKALILGTGGSSKAVAHVLKKLGIGFLFVSRSPSDCNQIRYSILNKSLMHEHSLIINTTPLGVFPNTESYSPIPFEYISEEHLLFDLTYNPEKTVFLKKGEERGAIIKNGLEMLQLQAERSWEIWNSK